ncbi:hypothetical protein CRH09_00870 [Nocardia terpenica]|uniref:Uncharacterized protein n=1 Tax=Nocardia terpenica TaxID=455432 RepID=A0A291RC11_9NOCA|nr:hypothetical protein CRH09_00870 [Nocardia terpenica]
MTDATHAGMTDATHAGMTGSHACRNARHGRHIWETAERTGEGMAVGRCAGMTFNVIPALIFYCHPGVDLTSSRRAFGRERPADDP